MSATAVEQFLQKAIEDEDIIEQVAQAIESRNDREAVTQVAAKYGYEFTPDELGSTIEDRYSEFAKTRQGTREELSDEALESVAGGTAGEVVDAIFSAMSPSYDIQKNVVPNSPTLQKWQHDMTFNTQTGKTNW